MTKPENEDPTIDPSGTGAFNVGLLEEERRDLDQMIMEFQQVKENQPSALVSIPEQIEHLNKRMAYLTNLVMNLDQGLNPLHAVIRLTLEKCDILNQRINTIIEALRSGEPL